MMKPTQEIFEMVLARPTVLAGGDDALAVHLWWRAPEQGERLVQVYVDGRLTDVSVSVDQREMWLMIERNHGHRIELLAVDVNDCDGLWREYGSELGGWWPGMVGELQAKLLRDERLPVNTHVVVSVDGETVEERLLWMSDEYRSGFGGLFGVGDFGFDAATGPGLGVGELGMGSLGRDGAAWSWWCDDLETGEHEVMFSAEDVTGQPVGQAVVMSDVYVDRPTEAARDVTVGKGFVVSWK